MMNQFFDSFESDKSSEEGERDKSTAKAAAIVLEIFSEVFQVRCKKVVLNRVSNRKNCYCTFIGLTKFTNLK